MRTGREYEYDADNRLIDVYSSRKNDGALSLWVNDAHYTYYLHGPLARMELGKNKVQGLDYAYTLQGWLKGVNGQFLDATEDMQLDDYKERVSYDPNGNILSYLRNGTTMGGKPLGMDSLTYQYYANNNQLNHIDDEVRSSNYTEDIDNQSGNNYAYDAIGNLISDAQAGISSIQWTVYGKIASVTKSSGTVTYTYDASGNRISKQTSTDTTVYVRDASGNTMSIYKKTASVALAQTETDVYGSSRLGLLNQLTVASQTQTLSSGYGEAIISTFTRGEKLFELSNHLGNVLVTVTDKKLQHNTSSDTVDYYLADVATAQDYYPFGMQQPGRTYTNGSQYRYGFNGKEKDKDISEGGQDYGMRIYDTRIGRFLSVDPLAQSYPWNSTYAFAENKVVHCKDLDGGEAKYYVIDLNADYPVLTYYKTKDFSWIPNFLEPDVASVEVLGLNVTYTFLNASSGKNSLWSFENVFQKDPIAAIYSGEYATDADIMGNAVYDLAFALLAGRAASLSPAKNKSSTGMNGSYFAQKKINSNRQFSPEGQAKYSKLAGSKIKTTTDLSAAIKNKKIKVEDVTVDYVMKNGKKVILNSRTSAALEDAGIPMDKWVGVDQTGVKVPGMDNKTFDDLANEQIKRNYKPGEELSTKVPESAKEPPKN